MGSQISSLVLNAKVCWPFQYHLAVVDTALHDPDTARKGKHFTVCVSSLLGRCFSLKNLSRLPLSLQQELKRFMAKTWQLFRSKCTFSSHKFLQILIHEKGINHSLCAHICLPEYGHITVICSLW